MADDKITSGLPPGARPEPFTMPPIPLNPQGAPKPAPAPDTSKKEPEVKDSFRELVETVVFVVVLVLMLKTFLAEAFVIPTGSMGDTLLGYHHKVTCKQCGYTAAFNASDEADPKEGMQKQEVTECRCENCGFWNKIR
jgi:signal peptidase I